MDADVKKYRSELKTWYKNIKASQHCARCGGNCKKEWHHKDPEKKIRTISQMVHLGYPKEIILDEMNKCEVLCHRCHLKTHKRK